MPQKVSSKSLVRARSGVTALTAPGDVDVLPSSMADFDCFGVNVTGPGIPADPRLTCSDPAERFGVAGGLVAAGSATVDLNVPSGSARKIQVFGIRSSVGCQNVDAILGGTPGARFNGLGEPYLLGSATVDLSSDTTVEIRVKYDSSAPVKIFHECQDGPVGPPPWKFTSSQITGGVNRIAVQPSDNHRLVAGNFTQFGGSLISYAARFNSDGTRDSGFAPVGTGLDGSVRQVLIDSSNRWIVVGSFRSYNGTVRQGIARLNPDGSLDTSFVPVQIGRSGENWVSRAAIDSLGRIVIIGFVMSSGTTSTPYIARLLPSGALDPSFSQGAGFDGFIMDLAITPSDQILVAGMMNTYRGVSVRDLVRLNTDGSLDTGFSTGTGFLDSSAHDSPPSRIMVDPSSNRIYAFGYFTQYQGTTGPQVTNLVRLNPDGLLDTSFNVASEGDFTGINGWTMGSLDASGKLLVYGGFASVNGVSAPGLIRLLPSGARDTSFNSVTTGFGGSPITAWMPLPGGKSLAIGYFSSYNGTARSNAVVLNPDGSLDATFGTEAEKLSNAPMAAAVDLSGKIAFVGSFSHFNGIQRKSILRLNPDNSLDTSFALAGTGLDNGWISQMRLDASERVLISGAFTQYNGASVPSLIRLQPNGSLDGSWALSPTDLSGQVVDFTIDAGGKILITGNFNQFAGTPVSQIIRLTSTGTRDSSFNLPGTGFDYAPSGIQTDPASGKLWAWGSFTTLNGSPVTNLIRLNTDGSLDVSISLPSIATNDFVRTVTPDSTGGAFVSVDGNSSSTRVAKIFRINAAGNVDPEFAPVTLDSAPAQMIIDPSSGKMIASGGFTQVNGTLRINLVRLNPDGSIEGSLATGRGFQYGNSMSWLSSIALDNNGLLLVGGNFSAYNGIPAWNFGSLSP